MATLNPDSTEACPVDHKTRQTWLDAAKAKGQTDPPHPPVAATPPSTQYRFSLDAGHWTPSPPRTTSQISRPKPRRLSTDREISTIPRAITAPSTLNSAETAALPSPPANNERETGHDAPSGNWIYPSQEMFFAAMQRKGHAATPGDMSSIVPIHNAVNERAWAEIKRWEAGWGGERCGGPRLVSFAGDSKALTPRARWNSLWGYSEPFDRHDWVVERCGKKVGYVIDFYKGKEGAAGAGTGLSFFLDVRPKLDSFEGWKMRAARSLGL